MLREWNRLCDEYYTKSIYVYGTNKDSVDTMIQLSIRNVLVRGLITDNQKYVNETVFNVRVYDINCMCDDDILVIPKHEKRISENELRAKGVKYIRFSDMKREICSQLACKQVFLYGTGMGAIRTWSLLESNSIKIDGFYVSKKNNDFFCKKEVYQWNGVFRDNEAIVITPIRDEYQKEILLNLCKSPYDVYVNRIDELMVIQSNTFVLCVDKALKGKKKIIVLDENNLYSDILKNLFLMYHINIEVIDLQIVGIDCIKFLNPQKNVVIVNIFDDKSRWIYINALYKIGFSACDYNITGFFNMTGSKETLLGTSGSVEDPLVGISIKHTQDEIIGWKILCKKSLNTDGGSSPIRIMILGNSTSQYGLYSFETWPEFLFANISKKKNVELYIGATSSDDIVNEYLRMIRDFDSINPDIVISFSGLTNLYDENIERQFNISTFYNSIRQRTEIYGSGIKTKETHYDFWVRIVKLMKEYVEQKGAKFICYLQPCCCYMPEMDLNEKIQFELSKKYVGAKCFYQNMNNNQDLYVNLFDLFFHREGMFIDLSHYSREANRIISDIVYEAINEIIASIR